MRNRERRDKIIDKSISTLKFVGGNDLLFGLFLIFEGLSLIYMPGLFPLFVIFSILIAYAFAIEWFFNVMRGERSFINTLQRVIIAILVIALIIYCCMMIVDSEFRINVDRVLVSATTIIDGIQNNIQAIKIETYRPSRNILIALSGLCIIYGIVYGILGGAEASFFTTTMHGIVFIFMGIINIWLFIRVRMIEKNPTHKVQPKKHQ